MAFVSAITGANAARDAARAQERGAEQAADVQREFIDLLRPSIGRGDEAGELQAQALGLRGPEAQRSFFQNFQFDPGFQSALDVSNEAIIERQNALGLRGSGGTLQQISQNTADRTLNQAFGQRLNQLGGVSGAGQTAIGQAQPGFSGISNALFQGGQARASGFINQQNALNQGIQNTLDLASFAAGRFGLPGG